MDEYLQIHHGYVSMQWNFIVPKIGHQFFFLKTKTMKG